MSADPYRYETPTNPGISISEVRMATRKRLTPEEQNAVITKVECPACRGNAMVTWQERAHLVRTMPELESVDLDSTDLDEVDE